jgi:hypothetical protein
VSPSFGTNVANVGFALMAQSAVIGIAGVTGINQVVATIPANSQIVDAILNVTTANDDGTASTVAVGTSADADAFIPATSVQAVGTTRGTLDTEATDVGTTDLQVLADFTATDGDGTAGVATVTILYIQNNNLS